MKVFVEIQSGSSFEIEVDHWDTVLEVKQKIDKSQHIPVSKQTLFFAAMVLRDDLDLEQYQIVHDSHLQLFVSPYHNPNPPSNSTEQIIVDGHQDSNVTAQTEQSPPSSSTEHIIVDGHQDSTVTAQTEQSPPSSSTEHIIVDGHQDSTVTAQTEQSPPSNTTEQIIEGHQDSSVTSQVLETELSPSSNSVKEITNIQDSSVKPKELTRKKKLVVHVWLYSGEIRAPTGNQVAVNVKTKDNVKELRNELVKIEERGELNLPQEGFLLTHKNRLLNENMSFWDAGVDHNDTIEILPLHLTSYTMDSKFLVPYI